MAPASGLDLDPHLEPGERRDVGPFVDADLRSLLLETPETETADERLRQTAVAQVALFAVEHALARLWISWGVEPEVLLGHSIGEYVAATLSGVYELDEALKPIRHYYLGDPEAAKKAAEAVAQQAQKKP